MRPGVVEQGEVTELTVELPLLTTGSEVVRLELEGEGVDVLSTRMLPSLPGGDARWSVRVRVDAAVGPAAYVLRPVYADGGSVEYRGAFTVVPAEEEPFPWASVLAGSTAAIATAAAGLALALLRRRRAA